MLTGMQVLITGEGPDGSPVAVKVSAGGVVQTDLAIDETTLATSAKQDAAQTTLAAIDTKTPAKGAAASAAATPVVLATDDAQVAKLTEPTATTAVVPHDANAVAFPKGLYVGTGGDVVGRLAADGANRTWKNVPSGTRLPGSWILVAATGTSATDMLGLA